MKLKDVILAGTVATGLTLSMAGAVWAQDSQAAPDAATAPDTQAGTVDLSQGDAEGRKNWLKVCSDLDEGGKACIMRQVVTNTGVFTGSFLLRDDPTQESRLLAVASVPIGVLLPFGLTWQIDGGKPVRVPYMLCDPNACSAQLVVNESYIQSLKRGNTLTLTAKNRQNQDISIEITLSGFTAAYDDPNGVSIEQLNQANSSENVLEQVLQDRANEMREQMEGQPATEVGTDAPTLEEGDAPAAEETPAQ